MELSRELIRLIKNIRELFGHDIWRHVQQLQSVVDNYRHQNDDRISRLQTVSQSIHSQLLALSSCIHDGMMHDEGWCFIELGRRIERASITCRVLDAFTNTVDHADLMLALRIADCDITWRVRHGHQVHPEGLKQLLLHSRQHPRSLHFLFDVIERRLVQLLPATIGTLTRSLC